MNTLIQNVRSLAKLAAVLAILVVLNLFVTQLGVEWDMTESGVYSLSKKTIDTVRNLDQKVTIYFFHVDQQGGSRVDPAMVRRLGGRYDEYSDNLTFREVDPNQNPSLTRQYGIRRNNTVVVASEGRTKKLGSFDLYEFPRRRRPGSGSTKFRGEAAITTALVNLTRATDRVVYFLKGHGEYRRQTAESRTVSQWASDVSGEGYTVETLNPMIADLPDTRDLMVLLAPQESISEGLLRGMNRWWRRGGNLIVASSPESAENLNPLLEGMGVTNQPNQILDPARRIRSVQSLVNPFIFAPRLGKHPTVDSIRRQGLGIQLGRSHSLMSRGDTTTTIMRTSTEAFAKPLAEEGEEISTSYNEGTDVRGPFTVGVAVSSDAPRGRAVVLGNAALFGNAMYRQAPGNSNFAVNTVNWIFDRQVSLGISATPLDYNQVTITARQAQIIQLIAVLVIPGLIIIWGGWVWWKRKNR